MVKARSSVITDYNDWLKLAEEVEPLFGPMVKDPAFCEGLKGVIQTGTAFCASEYKGNGTYIFHGGIIISPENNEILWFAVTKDSRGKGIGRLLLSTAIANLDKNKKITVTTFDETCQTGLPARQLYKSYGFRDSMSAGLNPAGIPIITMELE